jgi:hypothetical protein
LDAPEPPRIIFEQPAPCADTLKAEEVLRRTVAPSAAPSSAWTVLVRIERVEQALRAEAEITDGDGALVAHRSIERTARECAPLARAMGVWASLVLDAEMERAANQPEAQPPLPTPSERDASTTREPAPPPKPPATALPARRLEVGAAAFMMSGAGTGALAGPAIFLNVETGFRWFVRPGLTVARTISALGPGDVYGTLAAARFDMCARVPGVYPDHRGVQLDLCGGVDGGLVAYDAASTTPGPRPRTEQQGQVLPFVAIGPGVSLRGELASDLSVELRGVGELNVVRQTYTDPGGATAQASWFVGRAELGLSWRLR